MDRERYREIESLPQRIFAIGDIHGCPSELYCLLEHLREREGIGAEDLVVFVGDYVDRGFESRQVLELLVEFQRQHPASIFLRGNHEDMLLEYLGLEGTEGWAYLQNGGAQTLKSYGIPEEAPVHEVLAQIPREHLSFLLNLERYILVPGFVFVHAGLDPLRDLRAQLDRDLFWIRDEFLMNVHHFDRIVVFGHTPYKDVMVNLPYKVGIDTGLVYGNLLSCFEVVGGKILQVKKGKLKVQCSKLADKQRVR